MRKGSQSSLEYHVTKDEFIIFMAMLKLGSRIGRGENTSIILDQRCISYTPGSCT